MEQRWLEEAKTDVGFCESLGLSSKKNLADKMYLCNIFVGRSDLRLFTRYHLLQALSCWLDHIHTA